MRVKYLENEQVYILSNHAVARNALFRNKTYFRRFKKKLEKYLSPLCEIIECSFLSDQFQLIVKLNGRECFVDYFVEKCEAKNKEIGEIPRSTHIFSQAMANLQSSMAIHLNRKENRTGALFARRFEKTLIRSQEELTYWIERIKNKVQKHKYFGRWRCEERKKGMFYRWSEGRQSGKSLNYRGKIELSSSDLQGRLINSFKLTQTLKNQSNLPHQKPPNPH